MWGLPDYPGSGSSGGGVITRETKNIWALLWYHLPGWPFTCFNRKTTGWGTRIDCGGAGWSAAANAFGLLSSTLAVLSYTTLWWGFNWWWGHLVTSCWWADTAVRSHSLLFFLSVFPLLKHNYLIILPKQTTSHWPAHSKPWGLFSVSMHFCSGNHLMQIWKLYGFKF